jgi:hypothetical protein
VLSATVVDHDLDELLVGLPGIALDGPKGGWQDRHRAAPRRSATVYRLDDDERAIAQADHSRLLEGNREILIDEWQRVPESFDRVRRAVDDGAGPGCSCSPVQGGDETRRVPTGAILSPVQYSRFDMSE